MTKSCGTCNFYEALKGEPPAGYCYFVEFRTLPFWMGSTEAMTVLRRLPGSDVTPDAGANCDAFQPDK